MSLETEVELVERVLAADRLDDDDPTGDRLRAAVDRLSWERWKAQRPRGGWDRSGFIEAGRALWSAARAACDDDPRAATLRYARQRFRRA